MSFPSSSSSEESSKSLAIAVGEPVRAWWKGGAKARLRSFDNDCRCNTCKAADENPGIGEEYRARPFVCVSRDAGSSRARCGIIAIFMRKDSGCWIGVTCAHIFATSWQGNLCYDPNEDIIGKVAYSGTWIDRKAKDDVKTTPGAIHMNRPIGIVIDQNKHSDLAFVRIFRHIEIEEGATKTRLGGTPKTGMGIRIMTTSGDDDFIPANQRCAGPVCTRSAKASDLRRCAGCNREYYCSVQCQKDDRRYHKQVCEPEAAVAEKGEGIPKAAAPQ